MSNKLWKASIITTAIATATLLAGCGGSNNGVDTVPENKIIKGYAIDFALEGAVVAMDNCNNHAITDNTGYFELDTTGCNAVSDAISVTGGTDNGTGLPFTGTLKIKNDNLTNLGSITISPLTSLEYYANPAEFTQILANLGLSNIGDVKTFKPETSSADTTAKIFILQQLITKLEDALQIGTNQTQDVAHKAATEAIINQLITTPLFTPNVALTINPTTISNILADSSLNNANLTGISNSLTTITSIIVSVINDPQTNTGNGQALADALQSNTNLKNELRTPSYGDLSFASNTLTQLNSSSAATPISLSKATLLNSLNLSFKLLNSQAIANDTVKFGIKLDGQRGSQTETLNLIVDRVAIEYDSSGQITSAIIPANAPIEISSTLSTVGNTTISNLGGVNLASSDADGSLNLIAVLNSSTVLSNAYNTYYSKLATGDRVKATVYVLPTIYAIPNKELNLNNASIAVGTKQFVGTSIIGHFVLN